MFKPQFKGEIERCYFCDARWGDCNCNFGDHPDAPDFWDIDSETFITKPNVSICGRFFVDPVAYYGKAYERCAKGDAWGHWPVK